MRHELMAHIPSLIADLQQVLAWPLLLMLMTLCTE